MVCFPSTATVTFHLAISNIFVWSDFAMAYLVIGDHGREILQLLQKHPAGTIPVVVQRMKAKDVEWRRVRDELRKGWNEVLQKNYYKALDYRSNSFRQVCDTTMILFPFYLISVD